MTNLGGAAPEWDTDLAGEALRRLAPRDRGRRTLASFTRKVELLEAAGRATRPGDPLPEVPMDKTALRRLHDPTRRLWPWADRAVDAEGGPNRDLVARFHAGVQAIHARRRGGRRALHAELESRDHRIAALEAQVLALLDERRELREAVARSTPRRAP